MCFSGHQSGLGNAVTQVAKNVQHNGRLSQVPSEEAGAFEHLSTKYQFEREFKYD